MKKLRLLITLCALVISTFIHAEVVSGTCGANLTWTFYTETGLLKIEGSGGMYNYSSISLASMPSDFITITGSSLQSSWKCTMCSLYSL